MFVSMMRFGDVRMVMNQGQMTVRMGMGLDLYVVRVMRVIMVITMYMGMLMFNLLVSMAVSVMLAKQHHKPYRHKPSRNELPAPPALSQHRHGNDGSYKRRYRKVSRFSCRAQQSQGPHV